MLSVTRESRQGSLSLGVWGYATAKKKVIHNQGLKGGEGAFFFFLKGRSPSKSITNSQLFFKDCVLTYCHLWPRRRRRGHFKTIASSKKISNASLFPPAWTAETTLHAIHLWLCCRRSGTACDSSVNKHLTPNDFFERSNHLELRCLTRFYHLRGTDETDMQG